MTRESADVVEVDEAFLRQNPLPASEGDADKESRGTVVAVGGSGFAPGSIMLSGYGALRAGAGKLQLAVPQSLTSAIGVAFLETGVTGFTETANGEPSPKAWIDVRAIVERADAVLIGPGLMDERSAGTLAAGLLENINGPLFIIDAMALTGLGQRCDLLKRHKGRIILTPHAGEMARLTGRTKEQIQSDPIRIARDTAERLNCLIVLKGARTYIATPGGSVFRHSCGVVGLATAGSGDVLAGVMAGIAARGASAFQASTWGVFAHAQAGVRLSRKIGPLGLIAREIADEIPSILTLAGSGPVD